VCLTFPLKSVMHCGFETGNDKEWARSNEENTHFELFVRLIDVMP